MKPKQVRPPVTDIQRVAGWRKALIEDLGPDLQQCLRWIHSADATGLVIVLRSMRRCGVPEVIQQGTSLFWRQLTAEKRGEVIAEGSV